MISDRIHSRPVQIVKDVACGGGAVSVRVRKRRFVCAEDAGSRRTFVEETIEFPFRARFPTRLARATLSALRAEPRSVHTIMGGVRGRRGRP